MNSALFPLADKLRPERLDDFIGQEHLTAPGQLIHTLILKKSLVSMIFWGPPGTGKTTLARILAKESGSPSSEFSATVSGISEIKGAMEKSVQIRHMYQKPLVLFVDEIHHFNRHAQDAFLPYIERGDIILLGSTTENPAYKLNRALISRMKILEFFPLQPGHLERIGLRALRFLQEKGGIGLDLTSDAHALLVHAGQGDARRLLNFFELLARREEPQVLDEKKVTEILQYRQSGYDRTGDDRYQLISALHKSIRNSDIDAALYWLYRMLEGGEDPLYILRRLIRVCVEDVGLADPQALNLCLAAKEAYEFLGSPEGDLFVTQAAVYLACAPKSNALYRTEHTMKEIVSRYPRLPVPLHILNPDNFLSAEKGAGKDYLYAHDFPEKTTLMGTLPGEIRERGFYLPGSLLFEKEIRERMAYWEKIKKELQAQKKEKK